MSRDIERYKAATEEHRNAARLEAGKLPVTELLGRIESISDLADDCLGEAEILCTLAEHAAESPSGALDTETMVKAFKLIRLRCTEARDMIYNERLDLGCESLLDEQRELRYEVRAIAERSLLDSRTLSGAGGNHHV